VSRIGNASFWQISVEINPRTETSGNRSLEDGSVFEGFRRSTSDDCQLMKLDVTLATACDRFQAKFRLFGGKLAENGV